MVDEKLKEATVGFAAPPKMVYDQQGEMVEVILSYQDYRTFLRALAAYADWEELPPYLQDAVDCMLADEAWEEEGESIPLRDALRETGELVE
jgi:hypothetical protein